MEKILHDMMFTVPCLEYTLSKAGYVNKEYVLVAHRIVLQERSHVATLVYSMGASGLDYIRLYQVDNYIHVNRMLLDTDILKASLRHKDRNDLSALTRMNNMYSGLLKKREVLFHDLLLGSNRNNHKMIHDHYDKCEVQTADINQLNFSLGRLEI